MSTEGNQRDERKTDFLQMTSEISTAVIRKNESTNLHKWAQDTNWSNHTDSDKPHKAWQKAS